MAALKAIDLPGVGVEFSGVDIRDLSDSELTEIKSAYANEGVIFFRGQSLTEEEHIDFAQRWGDINVNRFFAAHPEHPRIALVLKEKGQKENIGGGWHTDHSYDQEPAMGSILVARELPPEGGNTLFLSMYSAYETLPDELKEEIRGKRAIHSAKHIFGSSDDSIYKNADMQDGGRIGNSDAADRLTDVVHPMVIKHPLSGKSALYVNPGFTIGVEGMDESDGKALLMRLFAHTMSQSATTEFEWTAGSVAFWDNRSTWHWAKNDYHGHRRLMHRITVEGCALSAA